MIVAFSSEEYYCTRAVKQGKTATLFLTDGSTVVFSGVNDWNAFNLKGGNWASSASYIPTPEESAVVMMRAAFAQQVKDMENDMVLQCSGLAKPWVPGDHKSGEVYNVGDQTWECFADYDNGTYPDVKPGDPSWFTFNRPLHGKSIETARPWVKPENGTTDIYHSGEYMVFTDGHTYKAKRDTNFSPEEYPADWEKVD